MDNTEDLFKPSLAAALMKLDPEDGEQIMEYLKTHALLTREKALLQASVRDQKKLLVENAKLKKDIEQLRAQLQEKHRRRSAKALLTPAPPPTTPSPAPSAPVNPAASTIGATSAVPSNASPPSSSSFDRRGRQSGRRRGERKDCPISDSRSLGAEPQLNVSRLDLRVGRLISVRRHPLAETMSIQEVDVGENAPRMVVTKLGGATHLEQLQGGLAVLLCNLKACKIRGVVSQGRLLCCSTPGGCVELLAPPTSSTPGDRVTFLNYPGEPDRELQSKQRVWERLQPDLQVDSRGVANYKGCGFEVKGKGLCRAPSLINCIIR
ncbi:aminoacyl tRNA synthase complex-interacting multifunctional protein 1-like [Mastacembelus armatus]|uniref:Aminoacyl tRNA synthetase complex interacting multifunctional protein 1b n=1 Tax=Mastacembelus armatus TaxID=205130 RepID=A0A3Q3LZA5_9TELE|nr:aminoacyl tRNA synthase complex-interacting multifunctional protein 1-like [Mastacembelus armatus]